MEAWLLQLLGAILTLFGSGVVAWITTRSTRQSTKEANEITGFDTLLAQYRGLAQTYQSDREADAAELSAVKAENAEIKADVKRHDKMFSGYRMYIRTLRGQVFDLGGTPADWPVDLDQ